MYTIYPKLDKDYVLSQVTQEEIFERYTGIPVETGVKFISPFRNNDETPSFEYYYNEYGRVRGIDWGGYFKGDCFDCVAVYHRIDVNSKKGFNDVLHIIARDFKLHEYGEFNYKRELLTHKEFVEPKKSRTRFKVEIRKWSHQDKTWWDIRLTEEELKIAKIYPVQTLWTHKSDIPIYSHSIYDPCYGYYIGRNQEGIDEWKFYFPYRKREGRLPRFLSNSGSIQGITSIKEAKVGVITKSYKDVTTFKKFQIEGKQIQSVAPAGESVLLTPNQIKYLQSKWDNIVVNFDYDPTGLHMMWMYRYLYGFPAIYIVNETWNSKIKYPIKDFYDLVKSKSNDLQVQDIIDEQYEKLNLW
jgi:hypothetical protein